MRGGIATERSRGRNAASVVSPPLATLWLRPEVLALLVLLALALETRGEGGRGMVEAASSRCGDRR